MTDDVSAKDLRQILASGRGVATGVMLQHLRGDLIVHLARSSGIETLIIDMEHGTYGLDEVASLITLARRLGLIPLVRPPDHTYAAIARFLDFGAHGIVAPRVSSAEDVRSIRSAMKYPPEGQRGMATQLGHADFGQVPDRLAFARRMNEFTQLIIQIELIEAIEAIDEILSEPGVDAVLVGPGDLDLSVSVAGSGDLDSAIRRVLDAGEKHGVPVGIQHADLAELARWREAGMRLLVAGTDGALLSTAMTRVGHELQDLAASPSHAER